MAILHGAELNIGRDGGLDYDAAFRRTLEWCVAGVHSLFDLGRDEQTRRVLAAMEDPTVHAIAHLTGRRIGHRPGIDVDVDAVLREGGGDGHRPRDQRRARPPRPLERGALPGARPERHVRDQHRHAPRARARAHGVGRAAGDARLRRPRAGREPVAARALPRRGCRRAGAEAGGGDERDGLPDRAARSSRCWRRSRASCPRATGGSSSRSGTASARSSSATASGSTRRAAT